MPRLYAIVDAETCARRGVSIGALARELRDGGVRLLQYRDKQGSPQQVLRAAAEISAVFARVDAMLVMNDRADLAVLAGWRGVHVGHLDMPPEAVRRVLGADAMVGVSTHTDEQVRAAEALGEPRSESPDAGHPTSRKEAGFRGADYIAIGPVFATASKADTEPVVGLDGVRRARSLTTKPLVAIGGITRANARSVIEAEADAVAVIGGLFADGESVAQVVRDFHRILG